MSAISPRMRVLMKNYLLARKSGQSIGYDIRPVYDENNEPNYEHYYIIMYTDVGLYKGQTHLLEMKTRYGDSENLSYFPAKAPYIRFLTKVWHVNISQQGTICLDILKDASKWSAAYKFDQIIASLKLLFEFPNPESPFNHDAGAVWMHCQKEFEHAKQLRTNNSSIISVAEEEQMSAAAFDLYIKKAQVVAEKNDINLHEKYFKEHAEPADELAEMFKAFKV
jgi:ubiquitin-protein ligase